MERSNQYRDVWLFVEHEHNQIKKCSLELLSLGRKLADDLNVDLSALLLGDRLGAMPEELICYGADVVYAVENPSLERYTTSSYNKIVFDLIKEHRPEIVLFNSTHMGMDLAPRVACELRTGLCSHCINLKVDKESRQLLQICPYFDYRATMITTTRPQMATVQHGVAAVPFRDDSRRGRVLRLERDVEPGDIKIIAIEPEVEADGEKIEDAGVIIGVGRGTKDMRGVQELAKCLGGVLGASMPVIDAGLLPESRMIGQTGKTVQPKLYVACGISGAGHHIVGMQNSGLIIAINTDEKAPIFRVADYGIVGDVSEVVSGLNAELKRLLPDQ